MDDLTKRLRIKGKEPYEFYDQPLRRMERERIEAADEITRLRARLAEVEKERDDALGWRTVAESNQAMAQSWQARAEAAEDALATARQLITHAATELAQSAQDMNAMRAERALHMVIRALKDALPQPPRDTTQEVKL